MGKHNNCQSEEESEEDEQVSRILGKFVKISKKKKKKKIGRKPWLSTALTEWILFKKMINLKKSYY